MNEKILEHLRKSQSYISGEELSRKLKISRAAVWKNIHSLIDEGYEIIAVPHLGYRLTKLTHRLLPREIRHNLNTKFIGKQIFYYEALSSTMDKGMQLALGDCDEGTIVVAESQTKGRGRLGRQWISLKYKGIYFSLILRPQIIPQQASCLTVVIAVSVAEALAMITGVHPQIKWPNDILLNGKKVGGILVEMNAEIDMVKFVVVGVGVNVSFSKTQLPSQATSLKEEGIEGLERLRLLQEILRRIEGNYVQFSKRGGRSIIEKWRQFTCTLHSRIKVICQKEHVEGEALDIDLDGGLLIRKDSGFVEKVMVGDVVSLKE